MMNKKTINQIVFFSALACLLLLPMDLFSQVDLTKITAEGKKQGKLLEDLVKWASGIVFGIGAFKVIVKMMSDDPHAKEGIVKWIVAVVFSLIAFAVVQWG